LKLVWHGNIKLDVQPCAKQFIVFNKKIFRETLRQHAMSNDALTMSAFENQDEIPGKTRGDACSEYSLKHRQRNQVVVAKCNIKLTEHFS